MQHSAARVVKGAHRSQDMSVAALTAAATAGYCNTRSSGLSSPQQRQTARRPARAAQRASPKAAAQSKRLFTTLALEKNALVRRVAPFFWLPLRHGAMRYRASIKLSQGTKMTVWGVWGHGLVMFTLVLVSSVNGCTT